LNDPNAYVENARSDRRDREDAGFRRKLNNQASTLHVIDS
jgi:hypothetical protein